MKNRKQKKNREKDHLCPHGYVTCEMCGRKFKANACSWQEDGEGALHCVDCKAELESCGCSD
ncbi:hypothetical protein ACFLZ5_09605 [Thermodesulfobacteriota bacterium]